MKQKIKSIICQTHTGRLLLRFIKDYMRRFKVAHHRISIDNKGTITINKYIIGGAQAGGWQKHSIAQYCNTYGWE